MPGLGTHYSVLVGRAWKGCSLPTLWLIKLQDEVSLQVLCTSGFCIKIERSQSSKADLLIFPNWIRRDFPILMQTRRAWQS